MTIDPNIDPAHCKLILTLSLAHCKFILTLSLRTVNSEVVTALGWDTATLVFFNNGKTKHF